MWGSLSLYRTAPTHHLPTNRYATRRDGDQASVGPTPPQHARCGRVVWAPMHLRCCGSSLCRTPAATPSSLLGAIFRPMQSCHTHMQREARKPMRAHILPRYHLGLRTTSPTAAPLLVCTLGGGVRPERPVSACTHAWGWHRHNAHCSPNQALCRVTNTREDVSAAQARAKRSLFGHDP